MSAQTVKSTQANKFHQGLRKAILGLSAAGIIFMSGQSPATAAELVVIASSIPGFTVGQIVASSKEIQLPPEASVTLISEAGKIISLKGPRQGSMGVKEPEAKPSGLITSISDIFAREKTESASLGAVRGVRLGGRPNTPDDPWAINVSKSGQYCVSLTQSVALWRPDSRRNSRLILTNIDNDKEVRTVWHPGQRLLYWPRLMRLVSGATYRANLSTQDQLTRLTIRLIPDLPTPAHSAVWMATHGCMGQAVRLLNSLR